jgi:Zn-dependent protease with chaperone function
LSETTFEEKAEELGSGRGLTGTTLGMFVPVAAIWLIAMLFAVAPIGALLGAIGGNVNAGIWTAWVAWTLGAGLVFLKPVEDRLGESLFGLRAPMASEAERLQPLWDDICKQAAIDPGHYSLRVEDSAALNAYAVAAHTVSVTRRAMELPDEMLQGILAHELGHHRDLHPVTSLLSWWFLLPVGLLDWCLRVIVRATAFVLSFFQGWLILLLWAVVLALLAARFLFFIPVRAAQFFALTLGRAAEYAADRRAVEMGYGPGLLQALLLFVEQGFGDGRPTGFARLFDTHPPLPKRVLAIEKRLAEGVEGQLPAPGESAATEAG